MAKAKAKAKSPAVVLATAPLLALLPLLSFLGWRAARVWAVPDIARGRPSTGHSPPRLAGQNSDERPHAAAKLSLMCMAAAPLDRDSAYEILGLPGRARRNGGEEPTEEEVKRAYRREALKWHPDQVTGDATRFQAVRDAYDLLTGKGTVRLLGRQSGAPYGRAPRKPYSPPPVVEFNPVPLAIAAALAFSATVALVLGSVEPDAPAGGATSQVNFVDPDPGVNVISSAPMTVRTVRVRDLFGIEYLTAVTAASEAPGARLLLTGGSDAPALDEQTSSDRPPRTPEQRLGDLLLKTLSAENAAGERRFLSVLVVTNNDTLGPLEKCFREDGGDLDERRSVVLSARRFARFERQETGQEILLVGAYSFRQPTDIVLTPDFGKAMAGRAKGVTVWERQPDLVVLDLPEAAWQAMQEQYTQVMGGAGEEPWQRLEVISMSDLDATLRLSKAPPPSPAS